MFKFCCCMSGVDKHFGVLLMDYETHKYVENLWFSILPSKRPKNSIDFQIFSIIFFGPQKNHFYIFFSVWIKIKFYSPLLCCKKERKICLRASGLSFCFCMHLFLSCILHSKSNASLFVEVNICENETFFQCNCFSTICFLGHKVKRNFFKGLNLKYLKKPSVMSNERMCVFIFRRIFIWQPTEQHNNEKKET